jgi:hypothetical protein
MRRQRLKGQLNVRRVKVNIMDIVYHEFKYCHYCGNEVFESTFSGNKNSDDGIPLRYGNRFPMYYMKKQRDHKKIITLCSRKCFLFAEGHRQKRGMF